MPATIINSAGIRPMLSIGRPRAEAPGAVARRGTTVGTWRAPGEALAALYAAMIQLLDALADLAHAVVASAAD
jgi:hypothetical protein